MSKVDYRAMTRQWVRRINRLDEVNVLGYEVTINNDGTITVNGVTYSVSVAGISDAYSDNDDFGSGFIKAAITALEGAKVLIKSVTDGMIVGEAGGQESKLQLQPGTRTYKDLEAGLSTKGGEFNVDGPRIKLKFSPV